MSGPLEMLRQLRRIGTPLEDTARAAAYTGRSAEELQDFLRSGRSFSELAGVFDPAHYAPGSLLTDADVAALDATRPLLRRSRLTDLLDDGRLLTVHDTGTSGAATLNRGKYEGGKQKAVDRYRASRANHEGQVFDVDEGDAPPIYGTLTRDPHELVRRPLSLYYPDSGTILRPDSAAWQYGQYGLTLRPEAERRATFTLEDSLDYLHGAQADPASLLERKRQPVWAGSALEALARDRSDRWKAKAQQLWTGDPEWEKRAVPGERFRAEQAAARADVFRRDHAATPEEVELALSTEPWQRLGIYSKGDFNDALRHAMGASFPDELRARGLGLTRNWDAVPRFLPRALRDPDRSLPLTPYERRGWADALGEPDRASWGYPESQVHGGVPAADVEAVYDLRTEPSSALEKRLRKLGIEYFPVGEQTELGLLRRRKPQSIDELLDVLQDAGGPTQAGVEKLRGETKNWVNRKDVPKLAPHYARGGLV